MPFSLGQRRLAELGGVHPDLVRVIKRAITITAQDFMVVQGTRTKEEMWANYGQGPNEGSMRGQGAQAIFGLLSTPKASETPRPISLCGPLEHRVLAQNARHRCSADSRPPSQSRPSSLPGRAGKLGCCSQRLHIAKSQSNEPRYGDTDQGGLWGRKLPAGPQ